jgi:cyclase
MQKITKNVFAETDYVGCNPAYVTTSDGIVIIDTPQLPSRALSMKEEVLSKGVIRYIINTEHHPDHVFGNYYFKGQGIVVGHENIVKKFMFAPGLDTYQKNKDETAENDSEGMKYFPQEKEYWDNCNKPSIVFKNNMKITVGGTDFELYYVGGHSQSQICVYCPQEKVLFSGDTIFNQVQIFFAEADPVDLINALKFISHFDINYIVPGHGRVCGKEAIDENLSFVMEWLSAVQSGIAHGWSKEECRKRISFEDKYPIDYGLKDKISLLQEWNVAKLYDYLMKKGEISGYTIFP